MKKHPLYTLVVATSLFGLAAVACSQVSNNSGQASITIVPTLGITHVNDASWGTVTIPSSGTTNYSLSTSTNLVTVTSGTGHSFGDGLAGAYTLTGGALLPVSYSVSIGSFSGSGVSVVSAYINGTSNSGSSSLGALGTLSLKVGGVLAVTSSATLGTQTATVTVTADYL